MKIVHISDLHIGKQMYGISLLDSGDQKKWIERFFEFVKKEQPQVICISGDIYDRSNPSKEAIETVDDFLTGLTNLSFKPAVMAIAGNHDAGPLVEYMKGIAANQGIYLSGTAAKEIKKITIKDEYGPVDFWLVPYVFPARINELLGTEYRNYDEAYRAYINAQNMDSSRRNVILAHQNITAFGKEAERGGSESMVGGVGGIDYTVFDSFEYAALGHIHTAQQMGRPEVRYAGSPLCYHFSELRHPNKGPVVINLGAKGTPAEIRRGIIEPLHPLREVKGRLGDIEADELESPNRNEYIKVILKPDETGSFASYINIDDRLRALFKTHGSILMDIEYEYSARVHSDSEVSGPCEEEKSLGERFLEFWKERKGTELSSDALRIIEFIAGQVATEDSLSSGSIDKLSDKELRKISEIVEFGKKTGGK